MSFFEVNLTRSKEVICDGPRGCFSKLVVFLYDKTMTDLLRLDILSHISAMVTLTFCLSCLLKIRAETRLSNFCNFCLRELQPDTFDTFIFVSEDKFRIPSGFKIIRSVVNGNIYVLYLRDCRQRLLLLHLNINMIW